ncbi:sensor histidine kinase [Gilvimarinus sp. F26214L]|uniref:sensor histidine kinase n=1 Tax=Gilvimarinus sp. DZF01 TaxID=3461371 RepID=UPI0040467FE8
MRSIEQRGDFLPDLCKVQAVFTLVLGGELLALALVLADSGLRPFNWTQLGNASFLIQWIVLLSAAMLCPLRPFLSRHSLLLAGFLSYSIVLLVTLASSVIGQWLFQRTQVDWWTVGAHLLLAAIFGGIVLRYFYIQQQLLTQEEAELTARIQALQSRIRPHFLFNSMNSIVSLIGSDPDRAERLVEDLSDLFRASLATPGQVPVTQELNLCRQYVSIEQLRLGRRLKVDWRIGPYPEDCRMPSLLLQPVIENAIYHGIQPRAEGGTVEIWLEARHNQLRITVRNPLPRRTEENVRPGNRMAMDNILNRLAALYGDRAAFRAEAEDDTFRTEIRIPFDRATSTPPFGTPAGTGAIAERDDVRRQ